MDKENLHKNGEQNLEKKAAAPWHTLIRCESKI